MSIITKLFKSLKMACSGYSKGIKESKLEKKNNNCITISADIPSVEKIIVKTYKGKPDKIQELYNNDSVILAKSGYITTQQVNTPGSYSASDFIFALLLCVILIGIIIFIYMIIVKPDGTLTVTYELRNADIADDKVCPNCAEKIKNAAKVCRYCGFKFSNLA